VVTRWSRISINEVALRQARLVPGWITVSEAGKTFRSRTSHPGQLSVAIPPWVGAMSTSIGWCSLNVDPVYH